MSGARLRQVFALDFAHNLRRPLFWVLVVILALTAFGLSSGEMSISSGDSQVGGTKAFVTSQFAISQMLSMVVLLFYSFFIAVAAGMSVISEDELKVGEILHSTPLEPGEYIWGKFLAVLLSFGVVLALHLAFCMVFYHLVPSAEHAEVHGPFALSNYLVPALLFALPTMIFLAGVSFALGVASRRPIVVFVLPVAVVLLCGFFLWGWSPSWLDPRVNRVLMEVDPSGFRWLNETWLKVDRSVAFYNTAHLRLDLGFLANRLAFPALGLLAVAWSVRRFAASLRGADAGARAARRMAESWNAQADQAASAARAGHGAAALPDREAAAPAEFPTQHRRPLSALGMTARPVPPLRSAMQVAGIELQELRSTPGLYLFIPLILIQILGTTLTAVGAFDTPLLGTPGTLAVRSMNTVTLLVCLLLLFYTFESLERERRQGFSSISGASPLRTWALLLGKALANGVVGAAVLAATFVACAVALLIQGRVALDARPFALIWGFLLLPTFLVWSSFVIALWCISGNRYAAYALGLATMIFTGYRQAIHKMNWVGNWDLWSAVRWSDMSVLELGRTALILNRVFYLSLALFFLALALRFYPRRESDELRRAASLRPAAMLRAAARLAPAAVVPLVFGIALWMQVLHGFQGPAVEKREKDYWRKNLATWKDAAVPSIAAADLDLDLDPPHRSFHLAGSYRLVNRRTVALERVPITLGNHCEGMEWTLDGRKVTPENRMNLFVFTPARPMQPGDSVRLGFRYRGVYPKGETKNGGGAPEFILPSSVVLTPFRPSFVPLVGYQDDIGIDRENKYEPRVYAADFYQGVTEPAYAFDPFPTHIVIHGPAGYTYNSVGTLVRDETRGGRRTEVWQSDYPVSLFNVVAGKWKVRRGHGTAIYYHPGHTYNLDEMSEALDGARKYYSEWFMEYPWKELKLSEFPDLALYAQGFPTNITFSEGIGFLTKSDPRANAAFLVTAHESAHQWWGNLLLPGKGPGGDILSEGMAHFSSILLFDRMKGLHQRIEVCKRIEDSYNRGRKVDSERPLVLIDGSRNGDRSVTYDKGGWVFWMLLNHMGRDRALAGLRSFLGHYSHSLDHPVLQDFIAGMRPFAPDSAAYSDFVRQWFYTVAVPEYKLTEARRSPAPGGTGWDVSVVVKNIGSGRMPVEVAAVSGERFGAGGKGSSAARRGRGRPSATGAQIRAETAAEADALSPGYRDSRAKITLAAGEARRVTLRCPFKPERVLMDPDALVLQLNRKNAEAGL